MKVRSMTLERLRNNPKCVVKLFFSHYQIWCLRENGNLCTHITGHGFGEILNEPSIGNIGQINEYYSDYIKNISCHTTEVEEITDG